MADNLPEPKSRKETYLAKAAGMDVDALPTPASREEQYLNAIAENGGGGGGGTSYTAGDGIDITEDVISVDTDTIQEKLTAGTNITIADNVISATGGGSVTPVQTTGTSTTDVMSQNATTSMVYADPSTKEKVQIGKNSSASGATSISIGKNAIASTQDGIYIGRSYSPSNYGAFGSRSICVGYNSSCDSNSAISIGQSSGALAAYEVSLGSNAKSANSQCVGSVNLGSYSKCTRAGEVNVGVGNTGTGYNSTNYRVIGGVHDGQDDHDAATLGQLNGRVKQNTGAPTTSTVGTVGQLLEDTTNGKLYQCTAVDTTDPNNPSYTWTEVGAGGGGPTVVQTTGASTTDVMSQDATTKLIYPDITNSPYKQVIGEGSIGGTNKGLAINGSFSNNVTNNSIAIGTPDGSPAQIGLSGRADNSIAIGPNSSCSRGWQSVAIGANSGCNSGQNAGDNVAIGYNSGAGNGSETSTVALGAYAKTTRTGEVNIGTGTNNYGYNSTTYRVLGGVHDPVDAHDAATKGYVDANAGGGVKVLSTADYNYPSNNPTSLAIWLLDEGQYITSGTLVISFTNSEHNTTSDIWGFEVLKKPTSAAQRGCYITSNGNSKYIYSAIDTNGGNATKSNLTTTIVQSTGTSTTSVMSQNAVTQALASAGGFHVLSAADINWEDADGGGTNNAIALWLLPSGNYYLPTTETMNTPVYAMATEEGSGDDGISLTDYRNYDILIAVNGDASYINIRGTDQYVTFSSDEDTILKSIFVDKRTGAGAILSQI